jgi:hypothetical protein
MEDNIKLTEEESKVVKTHQGTMDNNKFMLGSLRQQYLYAEKKISGIIEDAEKEFVAYVKMLAQSKNINLEDGWALDPMEMCFRKRQ